MSSRRVALIFAHAQSEVCLCVIFFSDGAGWLAEMVCSSWLCFCTGVLLLLAGGDSVAVNSAEEQLQCNQAAECLAESEGIPRS